MLLAAADSADPDHDSCAALTRAESGPLKASPLVIDLSLGATDASVIALAERHGPDTIATLDRRHFSVVRSASGSVLRPVP